MATSNLELIIEAFVKGLEDIGELGDSLKEIGNSASAASEQATGLGAGIQQLANDIASSNSITQKLSDTVSSLKEGFENVKAAVEHAAEAFLAYLGIEGVKELADEAANAERLALAFQSVGQNAALSKDQLDSYSNSLESIGFTAEAAEKSLTKLITTGVDLTAANEKGISTAVQLGELAQNLAATTGRSESEALDLLTFAIARQNDRMLRQIGLRVDLKTAEENYAQAVGITVGELTNEQKAQAFTNELLDQGQKFQGAYAAFLDTTAGKLSNLATAQDKLRVAIGDQFLPAYKTLIDATTESVTHFQELIDKAVATGAVADSLGRTFKSVADGVTSFVDAVVDYFADLFPELSKAGEAIGSIIGTVLSLAAEVIRFGDDLGLVKLQLGLIASALDLAAVAFAAILEGVLQFRASLYDAAAGVATLNSVLAASAGNFALAKQYSDQADALQKLADKYQIAADKAGATADSFARAALGIEDSATKVNTAANAISAAVTSGFTQAIGNIDRAFLAGKISASDASDAYKEATDQIILLGKGMVLTVPDIDALTKTVSKGFADIAAAGVKAKQDLKLTPGEISKGYDDEFEVIGRQFATFVDATKASGTEIANAFTVKAETLTSVNQLSALYGALTPKMKDLLAASGQLQPVIAENTKQFVALFSQSVAAAKTQADIDNVGNALGALQSQLSTDEFNLFFDELNERATQLAVTLKDPALVDALKNLGLSAQQAFTGVTDGVQKVSDSFRDVLNNANSTKDAINAAFNADLGKAKTIQDIGVIAQGFKNVSIFSNASAADVANFAQKTNAALDTIVQKLIKAAQTKADFAQINQYLADLGTKGTVSADLLATEMQKVSDAAKGTVDQLGKIADQLLAVSNEQLKLDQATYAIRASIAQVANDELAVKRAEQAVTQSNTQANQALLQIAQDTLAADQAALQVNRDKAAVEVATLAQIKAAQDDVNAAQKLSLDQGNALLIAQADAAHQRSVEAQVTLDETKEQLNLDESDLDAIKQQVDEEKNRNTAIASTISQSDRLAALTGTLADDTKDLTAETVKAGLAMGKLTDDTISFDQQWSGATVQGVGFNIQTIQSQLLSLGVNTQDAIKWAKQFDQEWSDVSAHFAGKSGLQAWYDTLNAAAHITDEIQKQAADIATATAQAQKYSDAMQSVFDNAEAAAEAIVDGASAVATTATGTSALVALMLKFQATARQAADDAKDATTSFLGEVAGIREQVLQSQGDYVGAAKLQYDQQKQSLAIEEQLLEVKIQEAIIEAKAAGLNDSVKELQGYLTQVQAGYKQAQEDIETLEEIAIQAAQQQEDAAKQAAQQTQQANQETSDQLLSQIAAGNAAAANPAFGVSGGAASSRAAGASVSAAQNAANAAAFGFAVQSNAGANSPIAPVQQDTQPQAAPITINFNVDGSDLLSEDAIRRKVVPVLNKILQTST